jgi:hypothetical protein
MKGRTIKARGHATLRARRRPPAGAGSVAVPESRMRAAARVKSIAQELRRWVPAVEGFEFPPAVVLLFRLDEALRLCDDRGIDKLADAVYDATLPFYPKYDPEAAKKPAAPRPGR